MMEMIIKISEKDYNDILNGETKASSLNYTIFHAIRNGILLPEGHGRLIDADDLENTMNVYMIDNNKTLIAKYVMSAAKEMLNLSPTIIEADKAKSKDKE